MTVKNGVIFLKFAIWHEKIIAAHRKSPDPKSVFVHKIPDVKKIRSATQLKQSEFADAIGVSLALVQSWETLRRIPNDSARKLLLILEQRPDLISALRLI
ncbi:helix-turn-helix domain-containing protein [Testudinibacter sp. P27/CKL/0425]